MKGCFRLETMVRNGARPTSATRVFTVMLHGFGKWAKHGIKGAGKETHRLRPTGTGQGTPRLRSCTSG